MSLSEGEDHLADQVSNLLDPDEPYLYRPGLLDHEGEKSSFRIVWQISKFILVLVHVPVLAPMPIHAFACPTTMVSTVSTPTVILLCSIYGILDHIRMSILSPDDRITSGSEGGLPYMRHSYRRVFTYLFIPLSLHCLTDTTSSLLS